MEAPHAPGPRGGEAAPPGAYRHTLTVSLRDLDALGHVNHAVYLSFLEAARTLWYCERLGVGRIGDLGFILGSLACTYHSPALFHERLVVALWPSHVGGKSWGLRYEIREERGGRLVARAETTQVQFDHAAGRSVEIPAALRLILEQERTKGLPDR